MRLRLNNILLSISVRPQAICKIAFRRLTSDGEMKERFKNSQVEGLYISDHHIRKHKDVQRQEALSSAGFATTTVDSQSGEMGKRRRVMENTRTDFDNNSTFEGNRENEETELNAFSVDDFRTEAESRPDEICRRGQ